MFADLLLEALRWLMVAFFGVQAAAFVGLVLWMVWIDSIKPRLIPADDIERVADEIVTDFADPEEEAFARHQRAWHRSDGAELTYWYRVRKAVRRRLEDRQA